MARKKQEIQLQREIETQEEWEEVMAMEGLWVIDVFQEWCGPCLALVGNFRRLKNELGDPLLNFAIAKADTIDALEKYRGRCEPTFLFYAGGILTSYIHGANSPKVQRVITEQLAQEHKVLEGGAERKEVKDPVITRMEEIENEKTAEAEAKKEAEDEEKEAKGVTVAIIKPDAVAQGKVDEIMNEMREQGIEIIAEQERELTDEEARELYSELENEDYFEDLIKFITSGPSHVLVITRGESGDTIVKDWREMIGPTNVEQAKEEAPTSLRAKYGEKGYMNALHGSSTSETAAKELAFFFPNLPLPTYMKKRENIQRTLALIRPEAFAANKDAILKKIHEAGFKIGMYKEVQLTKEQAAEFYKEHESYAYFDQLVENMSSGPVLALGLARDEAISAWREMLGPSNVDEAMEKAPDSFRAQFTGPSGLNQLHGSDSEETAKKELNFFFPMEQTIAVIKPAAMETKDAIIEKIHEAGFRIAAQKESIITRDIAELIYPEHKEKEYYEDLINSMTSGPTLFMVLSREGAVDGWRREIGEVDPEEAKASNPTSIRAMFGTDILNNSVHGSSNPDRAKEEMQAVFGDLYFNKDGTVSGEEPQLDETALVIEKDREAAAADVAPEYRNTDDTTAGETTLDETSVDPDQTTDTTQEPTVDDTQNVTSDEAQEPTGDTTQAEETGEGDTTVADTTQADTTMADTTMADTTVADDTTVGDTTQAEATGGDETTVPETTTGDDTAADQTTDEPTADATSVEPATSAEPQSTDNTQEPEPETAATEGTPEQTSEPKDFKETTPETEVTATTEQTTESQETNDAKPETGITETPEQTSQETKVEDTPATVPELEVVKDAEDAQKPSSPTGSVKKEEDEKKEGESEQKKKDETLAEATGGAATPAS